MGLLDELNAFRQQDLTAMAKELRLIDRMQSGTDKTLAKPAEDIYAAAEPSLTAQTTVDADHDSFVQMIKNALEKSSDPTKQGSVSDAVGVNPGSEVASVTGNSQDADLISGTSNQVTGDGNTTKDAPEGGFSGVIKTASRDLWDSAKASGQKVLNSVSTSITNSPEILFQTAVLSCSEFIRSGGQLNAALLEYNALCNLIKGDVHALDSGYYNQAAFWRTQNALPYMQGADYSLTDIRNRLIEQRYFDEDYYAAIREYNIKAAADALVAYGGVTNRVAEIRGAITALDYAMALISKLFGAFWNHLNNLVQYTTGLINKLVFQGPMLCMINQVQAEVRSIERSMEAALAAGVASRMSVMEKMWYMELLVLYHKMMLTPKNVLTYIANDTHGHKAALDVVSGVLEGPRSGLLAFSDMVLLQQQTNQYKYWAIRSLSEDSSYVRGKLDALNYQIISDNSSRQGYISSAIGAPEVVAYSTRMDTSNAEGVMTTFQDAGMDRANRLMLTGDWTNFFQLTPDNASSAGHFGVVLGSVISGLRSDPNTTFETMNKLDEAKRYVANKARAIAQNCNPWPKAKDEAKRQIVTEDLPEAQRMNAGVRQAAAEAGGDIEV